MNNFTQEISYYASQGYPTIPLKGKRPMISSWREFQHRIPTPEEIRTWEELTPTGFGLITGKTSGIFVLDIDDPEFDLKSIKIPRGTPRVKTGKGWHFYFEYPDVPLQNTAKFREGMDTRGEGGYVVAPPSMHKSGVRYKWEVSLAENLLPPVPDWLLKELTTPKVPESKNASMDFTGDVEEGLPKGQRNNGAARKIGKLLQPLPVQKWDSEAWPAAVEWNKKNKPPLDSGELRQVYNSISNREMLQRQTQGALIASKKESPQENTSKSYPEKPSNGSNQGTEILQMIKEEGIEFFTDQMGEAYTLLTTRGGKKSIASIDSKKFEKWLQHFYFNKTGKLLGSDMIKKVSSFLSAKADYESPQIELHNRIAEKDGDFWVDLRGDKGVRIGQGSWEVVDEMPILFRSYSHQKKQTPPSIENGDISRIFKYVRIKDKDEQGLFATWLVACFVPKIPHPILNVFGEKGAAKSSSMRATKEIIDPSRLPLLTLINQQQELVQQLSHHYAPFFDNVRKIKDWMSDLFCGAVTGTGTSKRRLYTDDDTVIYSFQRCIGFNGINNVANSSDLLDRSLQIQLSRIPKEERKTEEELRAEFAEDKPYILGGILNALAKARAIYPSVVLEEKPRMADFAKWGFAIAEATGFGGDNFLSSYSKNIDNQNEELIESDPVAQSMVSLMRDRERWEGTPNELYKALGTEAQHIEIDISTMNSWPKAANALTRHLNEIKSNLLDIGISFHRVNSINGRRGRLMVITRNTINTVNTVEPSQDDSGPTTLI